MRLPWIVAAVAASAVGVAFVLARTPPAPPASPTSPPVPAADVPRKTPRVRAPIRSNHDAATEWLRDRQDAEGRWLDPATTGIALLAFTGQGETHQSGAYRDVVKRGLGALRAGQDAEGCLVPRTCPRLLRDHAVAGVALVELWGMTQSGPLEEPAQRAADFALRSRTPGGAWNLPAPDAADVDVEATIWATMLLKSATMAELDVDPAALSDIAAAIDRITDPATGRLRVPDRSPVPISDDAATAIGVLVRLWCGRTIRDDPVISTAADTLLANPPAPDTTDLQHVYFGSLAMLNVGGDRFRAWLPALTAFVETPCRDEGPLRGSWDPPGGGGGDDDGDDGVAGDAERIRATSIHVLLGCSFYGPVGHALMRR